MKKENKVIVILAIAIIIGITILGLYSNKKNTVKTLNNERIYTGEQSFEKLSQISGCVVGEDKDAFAKCLTEKGLSMYGTYWCSHCQNQKKLFGDSFKYINYVECTEKIDYCVEKGVQGYPTWIMESATSSIN